MAEHTRSFVQRSHSSVPEIFDAHKFAFERNSTQRLTNELPPLNRCVEVRFVQLKFSR